MNNGIVLIILGLGYFLYQKHNKLTFQRKFLGFLLIFVVVLSIIPVINDRIFVRNNIQYIEIYNSDESIPNQYISTVEAFNYTNNYNWSTYEPKSDGSPNYIAYLPSDRFYFRNHIDSLEHALFIPNNNFKATFLYNLSAVSIKTPLNISYRYFEHFNKTGKIYFTDINVSSGASMLFQSPFYSLSPSNIWPLFVFLNNNYFLNPTNESQELNIIDGYLIKIEMQFMQTSPFSNHDWTQNQLFFSNQDWTQNQLYFLDEFGNIMCVIIYST